MVWIKASSRLMQNGQDRVHALIEELQHQFRYVELPLSIFLCSRDEVNFDIQQFTDPDEAISVEVILGAPKGTVFIVPVVFDASPAPLRKGLRLSTGEANEALGIDSDPHHGWQVQENSPRWNTLWVPGPLLGDEAFFLLTDFFCRFVAEDQAFSEGVANLSDNLLKTFSNHKNWNQFIQDLMSAVSQDTGVDAERKLFDAFFTGFRLPEVASAFCLAEGEYLGRLSLGWFRRSVLSLWVEQELTGDLAFQPNAWPKLGGTGRWSANTRSMRKDLYFMYEMAITEFELLFRRALVDPEWTRYSKWRYVFPLSAKSPDWKTRFAFILLGL